MKAYIDNNVLIEIEQNNLSRAQLLKNIDPSITTLHYSAAHLHEAHEITGPDSEKNIRLVKRFETITEVTENNYLIQDFKSNIICKEEFPEEVYKTITEVNFAHGAIKGLVNFITEEQREMFREQLDITSLELNNYSPDQVLNQINEEKVAFHGFSLIGLIEKAVDMHSQGQTFGLNNRIAGVFEILDMIGYWKDKYNERSNYARFWDSDHTFFSSFCDYFISDDKRTRNKAKVAFHIYGINTKVLSSQGKE